MRWHGQRITPQSGTAYLAEYSPLQPRPKGLFGADDRVRTGDLNLGKVALYQLSYVRRTRNSTRPRRGGKSGRPLLRSHLVEDRSDSCNDVHCSIDIEYPIDHR